MLTQCPNCQTTFRVTTEILRVADGQVRCGRCQTQFDALERLIDENDAASAQPSHSPRPTRSPAVAPEPIASREPAARTRAHARPGHRSRAVAWGRIEVDEPAAQEDITLEGRHIEISGRYRLPDSARREPRVRAGTVAEWGGAEAI